MKDESEQSFSFNLYAVSLLAILVIYFKIRLRDLANGKLLESSEVYCYQH